MSYLLLTLLLLPLVGAGLVFMWKNPASKYLALGIALVEMLLTFYILSDFNSIPTIDSVLDYEIKHPWSNFVKSSFNTLGSSLMPLSSTLWLPSWMPASASLAQAAFDSAVISLAWLKWVLM